MLQYGLFERVSELYESTLPTFTFSCCKTSNSSASSGSEVISNMAEVVLYYDGTHNANVKKSPNCYYEKEFHFHHPPSPSPAHSYYVEKGRWEEAKKEWNHAKTPAEWNFLSMPSCHPAEEISNLLFIIDTKIVKWSWESRICAIFSFSFSPHPTESCRKEENLIKILLLNPRWCTKGGRTSREEKNRKNNTASLMMCAMFDVTKV